MRKMVDVRPGDFFGRLRVVELLTGSQVEESSGGRWARVICECKVRKLVRVRHLTNGNIRSCGCLQRDSARTTALNRRAT
jgi:hypothetical protein